MDDDIEEMLVDVRIRTPGFEADLEKMQGALDHTLMEGFARAGSVLERGLLGAIRRGSLGFDDLKRIALQALGEIAAQAMQLGLRELFSPRAPDFSTPPPPVIYSALGALLGLPGRATGGPVAPARPYWVGERGPELFVPTAAGRVEPVASAAREVRVSIAVAPVRGADAPAALRRSSRQIASSVRRALSEF